MKTLKSRQGSKLFAQVAAALLFSICASTQQASASANQKINVQGKITDATGNALSGPVTVTFRLYVNPADPLSVSTWTETQSLTTQNGLFNATLGQVSSLDSVPFDKPYYLGMQVAGDANELQPRQLLGASAYALGSLGDFHVKGNEVVNGNLSMNGTLSVNGKDVGGYLVPAGAIMMFTTACPDGWVRNTALDGAFPRGSTSYGTTGGAESITHSHTITTDGDHNHGGSTGNALLSGRQVVTAGYGSNGEFVDDIGTHSYGKATDQHNHAINNAGAHNHGGATGSVTQSILPPYVSVVWCQKQ